MASPSGAADDESVRAMTEAVAAGDPEALGRLYDDRFAFIEREARRWVGGDEAAVLDLIHDVMMRLIRARPVFDCEAQLNAWLARTAYRAAVDAARRDRRRRRREVGASDAAAESRLRVPMSAESLSWLRGELVRLDRSAAQLLEWRYRFDLTFAEIGRRMSLSPGAAHARLVRVLATLRRRAVETGDE